MTEASKFHRGNKNVVFSPWENEQYDTTKCTVIVRLMNFLSAILSRDSANTFDVVPKTLWCDQLWNIIILTILRPQQLGFNMADVEVVQNLPEEVRCIRLSILFVKKFLCPH